MFQIYYQAIDNTGPWKMKIKITLNKNLNFFLNSDFAERMHCPKIKNETFIFSWSCELSICTMKQPLAFVYT